MKATKSLLMAVALLQIWISEVKSQGIKFETGQTWEQIKAKAKKENKYIFLDIYTTWCGPCKAMDKDIYSAKAVGDFYNQAFISVKVQMDSTKVDDPGIKAWYKTAKEIGQKYNINAYPTFIYLNSDGALVSKQTGLVPVETFNSFGADAMDPAKQYVLLLADYNKGKRDPDFVRSLIRITANNGEKARARAMALDYISKLSEEQMYELENIWCLYENTTSVKDRGFAFFRDHAQKIAKIEPKLGLQFSEGKVVTILINEAIKPYAKSLAGKPDWKKIDSALADHGIYGKKALGYTKNNLIISAEIMPYAKSLNGKPDWAKIEQNLKAYGKDGDEALQLKKPELIFDSEILSMLKSNPSWEMIKDILNKYEPANLRLELYRNSAYYYANQIGRRNLNDFKSAIAVIEYYFKTDPKVAPDFLNGVAWNGFEEFQDRADLEKALSWAAIAIKKDNMMAESYDTYANLLYKLGNKKEALIWEEKAIKLKPDEPVFKQTLDKMKANIPTWTATKA